MSKYVAVGSAVYRSVDGRLQEVTKCISDHHAKSVTDELNMKQERIDHLMLLVEKYRSKCNGK